MKDPVSLIESISGKIKPVLIDFFDKLQLI